MFNPTRPIASDRTNSTFASTVSTPGRNSRKPTNAATMVSKNAVTVSQTIADMLDAKQSLSTATS